MSNSLNRETLSRIEYMQEEDNEYNKVRNQFLIDIIKNDFYENMDRIALEETIPKSLVFYVFGSIIDGFRVAKMRRQHLHLKKWMKFFIN